MILLGIYYFVNPLTKVCCCMILRKGTRLAVDCEETTVCQILPGNLQCTGLHRTEKTGSK